MLILTLLIAQAAATENYVFFNRDRHRIAEPWFAGTKTFSGAQLKYTWRELEPRENEYNLQPVLQDAEFLRSKGKKLFVQVQDVSFDPGIVNVPEYLRSAKYGGGADLQYNDAGKAEGWVARRWDPMVRARFHALLQAMGRALDGRIAGLTLPETSIGISKNHMPAGFTFGNYRDAIQSNMRAARAALPHSVIIQYANFMPGEWLPWDDHSYLKSIYRFAVENGIGVGGPDLKPHRKPQQTHSLPLIRSVAGRTPVGIAVQEGNYAEINPATRRRVTIAELYEFASRQLKADYLFWCTEEPYFSSEVIPFLNRPQVDKR